MKQHVDSTVLMPQSQRNTTVAARVPHILEALDEVGDARGTDEEAEDEGPKMGAIARLVGNSGEGTSSA